MTLLEQILISIIVIETYIIYRFIKGNIGIIKKLDENTKMMKDFRYPKEDK